MGAVAPGVVTVGQGIDLAVGDSDAVALLEENHPAIGAEQGPGRHDEVGSEAKGVLKGGRRDEQGQAGAPGPKGRIADGEIEHHVLHAAVGVEGADAGRSQYALKGRECDELHVLYRPIGVAIDLIDIDEMLSGEGRCRNGQNCPHQEE